MLRINGCEIRTVQHPSELKCGPRKSSYFEPATREEIDQIVEWCQTLPNGSIIYVRGRDLLRAVDTCLFIGFKDWDYGFAVKTDGDSVFFLWPDQVERFRIREINFFEQLHFQCSHEEIAPASPAAVDSPAAVLLCHGFCPEHGPDYPLINVISMLLKSVGYTVIVPDFRSSYKFGSGRARSERVRIILESLLEISVLNSTSRRPVVMIGHSQGGAAVAQTCASEKVVSAANINGLILLGAESPIEAVRPEEAVMMALSMGEPTPEATEITHKTQPRIPTERMLFIHSSQDRVIHHSQIEQLAEAWGGVEFILLHCDAHPEQPNVPWAADLQHDFLTHDMLTSVVSHVFDMVSKCDGSN